MATLADIAKAAGVSTTTVSQILNADKSVHRFSDACARRVRRAADELGYVQNHPMRAMRLGRAEQIGFVMEAIEIDDPVQSRYWSPILAGVQSAARRRGQAMSMIQAPDGRQSVIEHAVRQVKACRLDGLVVPALVCKPGWLPTSESVDGVPCVLIDPRDPTDLPAVALDERAGLEKLVTHLAELGHWRFLWIGPQGDDDVYTRREHHFVQLLWDRELHGTSCRIDYPHAPDVGQLFDRVGEALSCQLRERPGFTAIVCFNDLIAAAVCHYLLTRGHRLPQDFSVTGFDNSFSQTACPRVTTVDHELFAMGTTAGEMLMDMCGPEARPTREMINTRQTIEPRLVVRESTSRPPAKPVG